MVDRMVPPWHRPGRSSGHRVGRRSVPRPAHRGAGDLGLSPAMNDSRRRLRPAAAGGLVLAVLALGACSLGTSGANAPTSTIPSTAFRTIPVSPPQPTQPTVAAAATTSAPAAVPQQNLDLEPGVKLIYTVQRGDCCPAQIAAKFDVTLEAFYAINGMDPKNPSIVVGQEVKIPRILPPTTVLPTGEKAYQVRAQRLAAGHRQQVRHRRADHPRPQRAAAHVQHRPRSDDQAPRLRVAGPRPPCRLR